MARALVIVRWDFLHDHSPYKQKGSTWLREHKGPDQTRRPLPWGRVRSLDLSNRYCPQRPAPRDRPSSSAKDA